MESNDLSININDHDCLKGNCSKMEAALASMTDAVFICDCTDDIFYFNEAFATFHRFNNKDACFKQRELYRDILEFLNSNGNPIPHEMWPVSRALRGETITNTDYILHRFDIDETWAGNYSFSSIRDKQGIVVGAVVVARDITEQKQNEEARLKLESRVQQTQQMELVGRLAGGIAHEFNNMLGVILGHAEMAIGYVDPAQPFYAGLEEIRKAAYRSANLTRQLLAFARKQTIFTKVHDLNEIIEGFLKILRRLIGKDIDLVWMPGAELWPVKVDASQMYEILANLCVNARDSILGIGKIIIETANCTCDKESCSANSDCVSGEYVKISVSDTGSGMDNLTLAHIFEPFFTTKEVGARIGLGLATLYGAVKQNSGFVDVHSEPGRGSIFKIYLPRYKEIDLAGARPKEKMVDVAVGGHETILLVEDEPAILEMTERMLQHLGYNVITASNPCEAFLLVEKLKDEIHLLITDVIMPEMNGRDLAERLMNLKKGMKCLFMSGYSPEIVASQGVLVEEVSFMQKPFSHIEMAAKIRDVIDKGKPFS